MRKSKLLCIFVAALLCLSSAPSFAEVCFTDEDYNELMAIWTELEIINEQLNERVTILKTDLSKAQTAQKRLDTALTGAQTSLDEAVKSLAEERKAATFKMLAGSGIGLVLGLIIGLLVGG